MDLPQSCVPCLVLTRVGHHSPFISCLLLCMTLFISITMLCGTHNILYNILGYSQHSDWLCEYSMKYFQSHRTLLWILLMFCESSLVPYALKNYNDLMLLFILCHGYSIAILPYVHFCLYYLYHQGPKPLKCSSIEHILYSSRLAYLTLAVKCSMKLSYYTKYDI